MIFTYEKYSAEFPKDKMMKNVRQTLVNVLIDDFLLQSNTFSKINLNEIEFFNVDGVLIITMQTKNIFVDKWIIFILCFLDDQKLLIEISF